jgi:O-antigen/teichoic acid export membrane protein
LVFAATATIYHKIAPAVGLPSDVRILAVICLSIFATQAADQGTDLFRYNFQPALYCVCLGVQTIVSSLISVYLIVFKNAGLIGYFVGVIIGATIVAVGSWIAFSRLVSIKKLNWSYIVKLLRFGLPLVPMSTGFLVLSSLDKWYIFWTWNASEVGKYAVCAKIVGLLTFIVSTFRQAWWPNAMEAIHQPGGETVLKQFASLYVLASVGGVLVLTGAAPVLIELVAPAEYRGSYAIIGVLAWQSVFYGLYLITSIGIWKREKTYCTTLLIGIAILAQAVLLDLFVPAFAGFGAAVSTAGSFFFWNICTLLLSQRLWPVSYDIKKFAAIFAFGAVVSGVTAYGYMSQIVAVSQIFALTAGFALIALCIQRGLALLRKENG